MLEVLFININYIFNAGDGWFYSKIKKNEFMWICFVYVACGTRVRN